MYRFRNSISGIRISSPLRAFEALFSAFCLFSFSFVAAGQDLQHITVRVLDRHSGRPVESNLILSVLYNTEPYKTAIKVDAGPDHPAVISIPNYIDSIAVSVMGKHDGWWRYACDGERDTEPHNHWYSVSDILSTGVSAINYCSKKWVKPKPGELVLFVRPMHWWEKFGESLN